MHRPVATILMAALAALAAAGGCSESAERRPAPASPEECFEQLRAAADAADWAGLYGLLSTSAQAQLDEQLTRLRGLPADERKAAAGRLGIPAGQLAALPTRDYFVALCRSAGPDGRVDRLASAMLVSVDPGGESAEAAIRTADGTARTLHMVREPVASGLFEGKKYGWFVTLSPPGP